VRVLVINCGSSSVKYQLIETADGFVSAKGMVERIGFDDSVVSHTAGERRMTTTRAVADHTGALSCVLESLVSGEGAVLTGLGEIGAVGHRFVNGGNLFTDSVVVDGDFLKTIKKVLDLAPLHNPANLLGIQASIAAMPDTPQVVVFDTAFHARLKPEASFYALPWEYYETYGVRRYGFHGMSHYYVSRRAAQLLGVPPEGAKVITCHLGNGCSIDAVRDGYAIETSMGFTPLEGLVMGTRTGDVDAAAVLYIMKKEGLSPGEMDTILNKKSGLLGFSGVSSDMREVIAAAESGNDRAALAIDIYCHRIRKYIAMYAGLLNGPDALVFTAGVGEHSPLVRRKSSAGLSFLGIGLDDGKNDRATGGEMEIGAADAGVRAFVIPTNEEIVIAREAERLCGS